MPAMALRSLSEDARVNGGRVRRVAISFLRGSTCRRSSRTAWLIPDETSTWSDDAVAASFAAWVAELDEVEPVHLTVTAAETLAEARAAGEV